MDSKLDYASILASVASNEEALKCLPQEVRDSILALKEEDRKKKEAEDNKRLSDEKEMKKAEQSRIKKEKEEQDKYLCKGSWGEKIPLNRRFALCKRIGKKFIGGWSHEEQDETKWVDEPEYCAIDLVRGFKGPYWGYYSYWKNHGINGFYDNKIKPILDAWKESELSGDLKEVVSKIRYEFDFFYFDERDLKDKFSIIEYDVDENGEVVVTKESEMKTLTEHQEDLKREFCND